MKKIDREELQQRMDGQEKPLLIEALPEEAFNQGHIPGAVQMEPDDILAGDADLPEDKSAPIITYCGSAKCPKSKQAALALEAQGYTNVSAYEGGKEDWQGAGLMLAMEKAAGDQYRM